MGVMRPNTTGGVGRAVHRLCREAVGVGKAIMEMTVHDMKVHGMIRGATGSEKCDSSCLIVWSKKTNFRISSRLYLLCVQGHKLGVSVKF